LAFQGETAYQLNQSSSTVGAAPQSTISSQSSSTTSSHTGLRPTRPTQPPPAALPKTDGSQALNSKLLTGMFVTGILGLPVFFPFGVSSLLIAGAIGASAFRDFKLMEKFKDYL
jgi:hypothetical protein